MSSHHYEGPKDKTNPLMYVPVAIIAVALVAFVFVSGIFRGYEHGKLQTAPPKPGAEKKSVNVQAIAEPTKDLINQGRQVYNVNCASCHGEKGEGLVGPNLTDDFWLHTDGTLMSIRQVVVAGVPAKGMPAWEKMLSPEEMVQVVAFLGTLRGTNVEGKEPQGEKVEIELAQTDE